MSPSADREIPLQRTSLRVILPESPEGLDRDEEWFELEQAGERRQLKLHDYDALYEVPGLYETLVYDKLKCTSPGRVVAQLQRALIASGESPEHLRVLDLGAGNGVVGEVLRRQGVDALIGVDIISEAAQAARRDRPEVFDDYLVTDLAQPQPEVEQRLRDFSPNSLVTVAALGFGDIPSEAFVKAFNLLPIDGWLAICIKDSFLEEGDDSRFGKLIRSIVAGGMIEVLSRERYVHRMSIAGEKLFYVALVARKRHHVRPIWPGTPVPPPAPAWPCGCAGCWG